MTNPVSYAVQKQKLPSCQFLKPTTGFNEAHAEYKIYASWWDPNSKLSVQLQPHTCLLH